MILVFVFSEDHRAPRLLLGNPVSIDTGIIQEDAKNVYFYYYLVNGMDGGRTRRIERRSEGETLR